MSYLLDIFSTLEVRVWVQRQAGTQNQRSTLEKPLSV
jgi:hypothetical protein